MYPCNNSPHWTLVPPYAKICRGAPGCTKGVQKVCQGCFIGVSRLLLYCVKSILSWFFNCYIGGPRVFLGCGILLSVPLLVVDTTLIRVPFNLRTYWRQKAPLDVVQTSLKAYLGIFILKMGQLSLLSLVFRKGPETNLSFRHFWKFSTPSNVFKSPKLKVGHCPEYFRF